MLAISNIVVGYFVLIALTEEDKYGEKKKWSWREPLEEKIQDNTERAGGIVWGEEKRKGEHMKTMH